MVRTYLDSLKPAKKAAGLERNSSEKTHLEPAPHEGLEAHAPAGRLVADSAHGRRHVCTDVRTCRRDASLEPATEHLDAAIPGLNQTRPARHVSCRRSTQLPRVGRFPAMDLQGAGNRFLPFRGSRPLLGRQSHRITVPNDRLGLIQGGVQACRHGGTEAGRSVTG